MKLINQQTDAQICAETGNAPHGQFAASGLVSRSLKIILALLLVMAASAETGGQTNRLSLAEAKRLAFQRNWDLLAARSNVDAATAAKIVSREFPNPNLAFSTSKISFDNHPSHTDAGNGLWERNYDTLAAINQLFEIGGKRSSRQASASAGLRGAQARFQDARRTLDLAVTQTYVAALLAQSNVEILEQSAVSLRHEARIAETRLQAGDISLADKSQIEIAAERLELDAQTARANSTTARIAVENLIGVASPTGRWIADDSLGTLAGQPVPENDEVDLMRPDWLAAQAAVTKAEADLKLQRAMRIPDPTLLFQYEHEPFDQPNTLGIGFSFPLPLWNRNRGNILAAKAARDQVEQQRNKVQAQIAAEIAAARVAYQAAVARLRRYREIIEPRSAEILKIVAFAYEKGSASLLDLLSAERNDNDIRLATAQAAADAATAAAGLRAALNVPNQELKSP